jgi:hypothetical protein
LEGGALLSDWWVNVSKEFVPYLNITTRLDDSPDQDLMGAKGGTGFPTLFFMEPETGAVLNEWWWPEDEDTVREALKKATEKAKGVQTLVAEAAKKPEDKALQAKLQIKLAMMHAASMSLEELRELSKTKGLDPEVKAEFDEWYAGALVQRELDAAQQKAESRKEFTDLASAGFYKLLKDGVRLPAKHENAQMFYDLGLTGAVAAGDAASAKAAFDGLSEALGLIAEQNPTVADKVKAAIEEAKGRLDSIPAKGE